MIKEEKSRQSFLFAAEQKKLLRRYLLWCYKTTKEDLDRIDRYFTQLEADRNIFNSLQKGLANLPAEPGSERKQYEDKVAAFKEYMVQKETNVLPKKFQDLERKTLQPDYWYLEKRLTAIRETIRVFLGGKELNNIEDLYEAEMTRRILETRDHTY